MKIAIFFIAVLALVYLSCPSDETRLVEQDQKRTETLIQKIKRLHQETPAIGTFK